MSFVALLQSKGKFQVVEMVKDGIRYLTVMDAQAAIRADTRFRDTGKVTGPEGYIIWQGPGALPKDLDEALTAVGLGINKEAA